MTTATPDTQALPAAAPPPAAPLVQAQDLAVGYGGTAVQQGLDFDIRAGEVFVVAGGSGCGKSTLLRCLVGLAPPLHGRVLYGERDDGHRDDEHGDSRHGRRRDGYLHDACSASGRLSCVRPSARPHAMC